MTEPKERAGDWPAPHPPQYTVEGEIHMMGEFAAGAGRTRGWRGALGRVVVLLMLVLLVATAALTVAATI